jgi:N-methylhydantoinase B
VLIGAFAQAVPDRVTAGCGPLHGVIFSGYSPDNGNYFVDYETYAGAAGALADQDGRDAVRVHVSGAANLPVESVEHEFPLVVERYELIPDTGGAGRFRGGLGTRRDVAVWAKEARLVGRGLRQMRGAPGLFGGKSGSTGRFLLIDPEREREESMPASFSEVPVEQGATVRVETPAGGGYGDPLAREPARVLADVIAGKVTAEGAERDYGVIIRKGEWDEKATLALRERMRKESHETRG